MAAPKQPPNLQPGRRLRWKRPQDLHFIFARLATATVITLLTTIPAGPSAQQEIQDSRQQALRPLETRKQNYNQLIAGEQKSTVVIHEYSWDLGSAGASLITAVAKIIQGLFIPQI